MKIESRLALAAAAVLLAGAGGGALAHPHPDGDGDASKVKSFVVISDAKGGEHRAGADRIRHFQMNGVRALANCDGGEKIVDDVAGDDDRKTKVIICRQGAPTAAEAERLEEALARIDDIDHLSNEQKARIETALRSAIDRARSAR